MKHLLIAGHGYIGQAVSRDFLEAGWRVTAVSRGDDDHDGATSHLAHETADLASAESITALGKRVDSPDFVLHCASSGRGGADAYRDVYLNGCHHLMQVFPEAPLLYTSSTSVYAQTDGSVVTEESIAEPDRETGQILLSAEESVIAAGGIIFRLAGIYGPSRSVILKKFLSGNATIEEDGRRFLNQIHRDDAATAIFHAATTKLASGIYNVSDSTPRSQLGTYEALSAIFGNPLPPSVPRDMNRKRGWTHKQVSNAKLKESGWKPRFPDFVDAALEIAPTLEL